MTQDDKQRFHLTCFVFELDSDELDELVAKAGLKWETATPQQVRDAVRKHLGDEQFFRSMAYGNRRFGYDKEFDEPDEPEFMYPE